MQKESKQVCFFAIVKISFSMHTYRCTPRPVHTCPQAELPHGGRGCQFLCNSEALKGTTENPSHSCIFIYCTILRCLKYSYLLMQHNLDKRDIYGTRYCKEGISPPAPPPTGWKSSSHSQFYTCAHKNNLANNY